MIPSFLCMKSIFMDFFFFLLQISAPYVAELKQRVQQKQWWFHNSFWHDDGEGKVFSKCAGKTPRISVSSSLDRVTSLQQAKEARTQIPARELCLAVRWSGAAQWSLLPYGIPSFYAMEMNRVQGSLGAWENIEPMFLKFTFNGSKFILSNPTKEEIFPFGFITQPAESEAHCLKYKSIKDWHLLA